MKKERHVDYCVSYVMFTMFWYGQKISTNKMLRKVFKPFYSQKQCTIHANCTHINSLHCKMSFLTATTMIESGMEVVGEIAFVAKETVIG